MTARGLLHNGDYLKLLTGQTISSIGSSMSSFVFTLLGLAITGSPVQAGLVGTSAALGGILAALPGGALADRWSRRKILIGYSLLGTVLFGSVAVVGWLGHLTLPHLMVVGLVNGAGYGLFMPAETGALRQIVPPEDLGTALAAAHGRQNLAGLAGAPLGGLLYSIGRAIPIAVDAVSYLVMAIMLTTIRHPLPATKPEGGAHEPMLKAIRSGLTWLFRQRDLRTIAVVATLLNFAANGTILVLILSMQQRGVPASVIGLLETAMGVGGLAGAFLAPRLLARFSTGRITIVGAWIIAVTFASTAATTQPVVLILLPALAIFLLPALNSGLFGYQMLITPDHLQGRAQSAFMFLSNGAAPLAPFLGGLFLETLGARGALLIFGGLLAIGSVLLTISRSIRSIPLLSEVEAA
ncbi:putative MFS family arabinose efflux permease [Kribbella sp. VKM Ac-2569]|uniref:MFS transporter n=1 Tax=Kribbella sp. VKM Ac-2569 TaxID=2512220 RepID=UPI00102C10EC|nr:MFS transporter [Kribbella sp. VKM Ac-2569]RZT12671.1 putative MFS family arabinose efflux permease [Kribbella sp. VKM Ac-2569]